MNHASIVIPNSLQAALWAVKADVHEDASEAGKRELSARISQEIAILDAAMSGLRTQYGPAADEAIAQMRIDQGALLGSLMQVQHAKHPRELQAIRGAVDTAIRHSTETRNSAAASCEGPSVAAKTLAKAVVVAPIAGSVSAKFMGKFMGAGEYREALSMLAQRGRVLLDGFAAHIEQQVALAEKHAVDIGRSQQAQATLLQQAREAFVQEKPAEAASHITQAATLGLRDAERVRQVHDDAATRRLVEQAERNSTHAVRHAIDQMQIDARRDCSKEGGNVAQIDACTVQGTATRIDVLRLQMVRIQVQVGENEDAATERMNRILRSAAPQDARQQEAGQSVPRNVEDFNRILRGEPAGNASVRLEVQNVTVVSVTSARPETTPANDAGAAPQPTRHVMGPR